MNKKRNQLRTLNDMFEVYHESCEVISQNTINNMNQLCESSLQILEEIFTQYATSKRGNQNHSQVFSAKENFDQNSLLLKFSQQQLQVSTPIIPEKPYFYSVKKQISKKKTLSQELDQINLLNDQIDEFSMNNSEISPKKANQLKFKSISQLVSSKKQLPTKIQQKVEEQDMEEVSEYQITDHSSNSSSNEGYCEPVEKEEIKPLFGELFQKSKSEDAQPLFQASKLNFNKPQTLNFDLKSINLLKSPKKTPKKKRLYVGQKLIPRWAEDKKKFEEDCLVDPKQIFGECKVQNLDTNLIFKVLNENIQRTSSAKWNPYQFKF